jgi:membrane-bound lytic murein transglycosylase B
MKMGFGGKFFANVKMLMHRIGLIQRARSGLNASRESFEFLKTCRSPRRVGRMRFGLIVGLMFAPAFAQSPGRSGAEFGAFLQELWPQAKARGVARATFEAAFTGVTPDPRVIAAIDRQPEFNKPMGDYLATVVAPGSIAIGIRKVSQWANFLDTVEKRFGVDRSIIVAIWGLESSYGAEKDRWDLFRSLATLAEIRFRQPYFRDELLTALEILQDGHLTRDRLTSSWAGAMGQPQFMPSTFKKYAVGFSANGTADIWTNVPDVFASIANYLHEHGWEPGVPWGFEAIVPRGFDYRRSRASYAEWLKLGVHRADYAAYPANGTGILFFPSGSSGPAFMATDNYPIIKQYNNSDSYALAVGLLADRLRGQDPVRGAWPRDEQPISRLWRIALQRKLAELGYKINDFEGHIDFDMRDSIRDVQVKFAMVPDGNPNEALLRALGIERP